MQNVQDQLVVMVQDMHKKINEMHTDWKSTGFGNHTENDTKWLEVSIIFITIHGFILLSYSHRHFNGYKYYIIGYDQSSNLYLI
jgi:hypothetical protein